MFKYGVRNGIGFSTRRLFIVLIGAEILIGQSNVSVVASGYIDPAHIALAPGQVTTLYLRNVRNAMPRYMAASGFPLPTTLAGLSLTLRQFSNVDPIPVPILSVRQLDTGCPNARPDILTTDPCRLIAVTIQVPTGLSTPLPASPPDPNRRQELVVSENGSPGPAFAYYLEQDNIHVVTNCGPIEPFVGADCRPELTHADGSLVQGGKPAQPGEILVVYALGLGGTNPVVSAGSPAPFPAAALSFPLRITFNFTPNTKPTWLGPTSATLVLDQAVFAGLTPGLAGLYQVNFRVPVPPAGTPACLTPNVQSNVTITLLGNDTFDGAQFCVQVPDSPRAGQSSVIKR